PSFIETVRGAKITVLLGLSGQPCSFTEESIRALHANTTEPMVFALSNPTSACEALPADILKWTDGAALIATGSPFDPVVDRHGVTHTIGQGNNAFIFPGIGFGAILTRASKITDAMVREAAYALSDFTLERYASKGLIYPPVEDLRDATARVAA